MSGVPTQEWLDLETPENHASILRGKAEWQSLARPAPTPGRLSREVAQLRDLLEARLAHITDPALEGAWLDITGRHEPIFVDATEARRRAGLPDIPGRRVIGNDP
jgi:hypothetical protein